MKLEAGKLKIGGTACSVYPYGVAIVKTLRLDQAVEDAIKYLIDNDFYTSILNTWGVRTARSPALRSASTTTTRSAPPACRRTEIARPRRLTDRCRRQRPAPIERPAPGGASRPAAAIRRFRCVTRGGGSLRSSCSRLPRQSSTLRHRPRISSGASSASSCSIPRSSHGVLRHPGADGDRDGHRGRARRDPRRDAPVREPGRLLGELVLHLVLPRHAGAGADLLLVQHRLDPPHICTSAYRSPTSCGSATTNKIITPVSRGDPRARSQRGRVHVRDRPRGHHLGGHRTDRGGAGARHDARCW